MADKATFRNCLVAMQSTTTRAGIPSTHKVKMYTVNTFAKFFKALKVDVQIRFFLHMGPLLCRKQRVELSCGLVSSKVPANLEIWFGVIRALLSTTDNSPEALGAQDGLYFPLPSGIVEVTKFFEGRCEGTGGFICHGDKNVLRMEKES